MFQSFLIMQISMFGIILVLMFFVDVVSISLSFLTNSPQSICPYFDSLHPKSSPHLCLISAIDYNQFTFFLLANLSTGLVNFTVDTMNTSTLNAFLLLSLHLVSLCVLAIVMKRYRIKIM